MKEEKKGERWKTTGRERGRKKKGKRRDEGMRRGAEKRRGRKRERGSRNEDRFLEHSKLNKER